MDWKNSIEKRLTFLFMILMLVLFSITSAIGIAFSEASKAKNDSQYIDKLMQISFALIRTYTDQARIISQDYAEWDETYDFVRKRDTDFLENQLSAVDLESSEIQGLAIHSPNGGLLHGINSFGYLENQSLWSLFDNFDKVDMSTQMRGIVFDQGRVFIYCSTPITGTGSSKEAVGRLTVLKQITQDFSEYISQAMGEKFMFVNTLGLEDSLRFDIYAKWSYQRLSMAIDEGMISSTYQLTHDSNHILPLNIEVDIARFNTSNSKYWVQLFPEFIVIMVLSVVLLYILRQKVTTPIKDLIEWLGQVGEKNMSEDLKPFDRAEYGEIGVLSKQFEEIYNDLYEQHQFSQILLYSISDFIFTVDSEGRIDYCNPAAAEWLNIDSRTIQHQEFELLLACLDEEAPSVSNWLYRALHTYSEYSGEANIRIISQPERVFKMQVQVSPMLQAEEGQKGAMVILRPLD